MAKHDKPKQQPTQQSAQKPSEQPAAMTPGRIGFEAYGNHPGPQGAWKTFDGRPIPTWENLAAGKNNDGSPNTGGPLTCERWEVAAGAVLAQQEAELARLKKAAEEWEAAFKEENKIRLEYSEQVRTLRGELEKERARANDEYQRCEAEILKSTALRSDLMVLEQALAGRVPEVPLQTDFGKSAAAGLGELLHSLATLREQRQDGDALPANGWASESARQLVAAIEPQPGLRASDVRALLLGDLLAQLLPHTGETGQNETASDVLKRLIEQRARLADGIKDVQRQHLSAQEKIGALSERMVKVQSAMVARRAPDAVAGAVLSQLGQLLGSGPGLEERMVDDVKKILKELDSCRAFFSEAPLVAVAVRDDGAKVHERFSLLVLNWDGKAVSTRAVEEVRPWGDISPYLEQTVRKSLIPGAYR